MLPYRIIADNILNLTDARYFAARGVDYLCLNSIKPEDNISIEEIIAISEWIDGPEVVLHFLSQDYFIDITPEFDPNGWIFHDQQLGMPPAQVFDHTTFLCHPISDLKSIEDTSIIGTEIVLGFDYLIVDVKPTGLSLSQIEEDGSLPVLQAICAASAVFLDAIIRSKEDLALLERINPEGIVLHGGKEDEVGVKIYDDLDMILDSLEDMEG